MPRQQVLTLTLRTVQTLEGLAAQSRWDEVEALSRSLLDFNPGEPNGLRLLAEALMRKERWREASDCLAEAIASAGFHAPLHARRAESLSRLKEWDEASRCWANALALDPAAAPWHLALGDALVAAGKRDEAAAAYACALTLDPTLPRLARRAAAVGVRGASPIPPSPPRPLSCVSPPRVLVVSETWLGGNPALGPSNIHENVLATLSAAPIAAPIAALESFHGDACLRNGESRPDAALVALAERFRPDVIIISWAEGLTCTPLPQTLGRIRRESGAAMVALWWDSVRPGPMAACRALAPFVDLHVALDRGPGDTGAADGLSLLPLWTPQNPCRMTPPPPDLPRDIPLSFVGTVAGYPDRQALLAACAAAGVPVQCFGGQHNGQDRLDAATYASLLQRSRISLNFSLSHGRWPQAKGRMFEITHCGALLVETGPTLAPAYFRPGEEFVACADAAELVARLRHYLTHEDERCRIAAAGQQRALRDYSAPRFWEEIFTRLPREPSGNTELVSAIIF